MISAFYLILGLLCLLYYAAMFLSSGLTTNFSWIWAVAGVTFVIFFFLLRRSAARRASGFKGGIAPGVIGTVTILLVLFLGFFGWQVISGMASPVVPDLDYVIVLGAQVKGKVPSKSLARRLETALDYANANPETILILSGGRGPGEDITEAECMSNYLTAHGISKDRLVEEVNSISTRENLQFSDTMTGCAGKSCGLISNNFHMFRVLRTARSVGYQDPHGICAPSNTVLQVHFVVREIFALARDEISDWIREIAGRLRSGIFRNP